MRRFLGWIIPSLILVVLLPPAILYVGSFIVELPEDLDKEDRATGELVDSNGMVLAKLGSDSARVFKPLPLREMGDMIPEVILSIEDHRFFQHRGIDWKCVLSASVANLRKGRVVSGASTVSQQVVKIASKRKGRSISTKIREAMMALKLERVWSKERILAYYLNHVSFSNRIIGIEAASENYFGKKASELKLGEAVFLSGIPQAPSRFNPWSQPENAKQRYHFVLKVLLGNGYFSKDEFEALTDSAPHVLPRSFEIYAPHLVAHVASKYPNIHGIVETTLDMRCQRIVETSVSKVLAELEGSNATHVAVLILENGTGRVRALEGSGNFFGKEGQINGALTWRGAGSTLKPFIYAFCFDHRSLTPASLLADTPDAISKIYSDYAPKNFDNRFWGPVRVREALGCSMNVPAVIAIHVHGPRKSYTELRNMGFVFLEPFEHYGAGLALGNAEIRLIDLTSAFSAFSSNGLVVSPRFLESEPIVTKRAIQPATASLIVDILSDNRARAKTFGLQSPLAFAERIPCKTGTSSSFRDNWTVGSTQQHTVGVWMGNFDGTTMEGVSSVVGAAKVFNAVVRSLLDSGDTEVEASPSDFEELCSVEICKVTGLIPSSDGSETIGEWFYRDNVPTESSERFFRSSPCGKQRILALPLEYAAWCRSPYNWMGAVVEDQVQNIDIINPPKDSVYRIVDYLPMSQQCIRLQAIGGSGDERRWFVDDKEIAPTPGGTFWTLTPGSHTIRVTSGAFSDSIVVTVRGAE